MKQIFYIIAVSLLAFGRVSAQDEPKPVTGDYSNTPDAGLQVKPDFPGGVPAFYQYIIDNFKPESKFRGTHKLRLMFVVEKDGTIGDVTILKGLDEKNDQKLIEVIKASPKWTPGYQEGKPVRARYGLPLTINFH